MREIDNDFETKLNAFINYVFTPNKKSRQSEWDKRQKEARDEMEIILTAKEIGCERELLR